jgi:hypothetical protein
VARRIDSIDFWRGFVLVCIFINHIPGNSLGYLTPRNLGFSDSAEAFVFLAGVSVVLAYARRFAEQGPFAGARPPLVRAARLYVVHIVVSIAGFLLFAGAAYLADLQALLLEDGRSLILEDPSASLSALFSLDLQFGFYNILPLYIVLLVATPLFLSAGLRSPVGMLAGAATLYTLTRVAGLGLPTNGLAWSWYLNPLTWQLMFAFGVMTAFAMKNGEVPVNPALTRISLVYVAVSGAIVSNMLGLAPGLVDDVGVYLDWDKGQLGTIRLVDFLLHAYAVYALGLTAKLRPFAFYQPMAKLGRHSLVIFCCGSLLSSLGQILTEIWPGSIVFDIVFVGAGVAVLLTLASFIEWQRRPVDQQTA